MKKFYLVFLIIIFAGLVTAGVGLFLHPYDPIEPPVLDSSNVTLEGVKEISVSNNKFTIDLYNKLEEDNENVFLSPYSIYSALLLTYEGSDGITKEEFQNVFYYPEDQVLKENYPGIYNSLNQTNNNLTLRTGNALWVDKSLDLIDEYSQNVESHYGGKAAIVDFANEPTKSVATINDFISQQTNGKIEDLLSEGSVGGLTKLILTNAVYFKGDWKYKFDKKNTKDLYFNLTSDEKKLVSTMVLKNLHVNDIKLNYYYDENVQFLELPYSDSNISMYILLPIENVTDFSSFLDYDYYSNLKNNISLSSKLDFIQMPKFKFEKTYSSKLVDGLKELGLVSAFSDSLADFSKISSNDSLLISNIIHKSYIEVYEEGSEAAAATAIIMDTESMMPITIDYSKFIADHPFVFFIEDTSTDTILFLGKVFDPSLE